MTMNDKYKKLTDDEMKFHVNNIYNENAKVLKELESKFREENLCF